MSVVKSIGILVLVLVSGFFLIKVAGTFIDVNGMESDLENHGSELHAMISCIGSPRCEQEVIDEIERIREAGRRNIELNYETLDYDAAYNEIVIDGVKPLDFIAFKHTHRFTLRVRIWK